VLLLAGQIDHDYIGRDWGILHEHIDQAAVFEQVTKFQGRPRTADQLPETVRDAIRAMLTGRNRPAYVEMPTDLQVKPLAEPIDEVAINVRPPLMQPDPADVENVAALLGRARRPLIIAGTGVLRAWATNELVRVAERLDAPVLVTMSGGGAIPADHPLYAGYLISRHPAVLDLLAASDLVFVVGSRLDAQTSDRWRLPLPNMVHLDIDGTVINRIFPAQAGIVADARPGLAALADALGRDGRARVDDGWGTATARAVPAAVHASVAADRRDILAFMDSLRSAMPRDVITTHDAATFNGWSGYFWPTYVPEGNIWPWGSAALGFALPIGIGAAVAAPGRRVLAFMGDGGFGFTAMELATAAKYGINITVIVHNDNAFSSIGNYQRVVHGREYQVELHNPDFVQFARSFGARAVRVERWEDAAPAAVSVSSEPGPAVVEIAAPIKPPFDRW
jgi:thiamine pyrophosphate-dependent acetolactate synthase large subunit-like protein